MKHGCGKLTRLDTVVAAQHSTAVYGCIVLGKVPIGLHSAIDGHLDLGVVGHPGHRSSEQGRARQVVVEIERHRPRAVLGLREIPVGGRVALTYYIIKVGRGQLPQPVSPAGVAIHEPVGQAIVFPYLPQQPLTALWRPLDNAEVDVRTAHLNVGALQFVGHAPLGCISVKRVSALAHIGNSKRTVGSCHCPKHVSLALGVGRGAGLGQHQLHTVAWLPGGNAEPPPHRRPVKGIELMVKPSERPLRLLLRGLPLGVGNHLLL